MGIIIFKNIKGLAGIRETLSGPLKGEDLKTLPVLENAWLVVADEVIADWGPMETFEQVLASYPNLQLVEDAEGKFIIPAFCDSHTHIVYAGSRENEFVYKIKGMSYEEIAQQGGGILNSAQKLQQTSEEELLENAHRRLTEMIRLGTGAIEIKSGYGLTVKDEIKMLRVIRELKAISPIQIKSTFLGAHAVPAQYKDNRNAYIQSIVHEMIPLIADEQLADYCDVFCDKGFFTVAETDIILEAAIKAGLKAKIHANELDYSGGIQVGVKHQAISVDHLEFTGAEEIEVLLNSSTIPTLLPSTAFFLRLHYPPARTMIDAGLPVALASDYNPGSSPSGNMFFVMSLACIQMKMLPEEALQAATMNAAYAMELQSTHGTITKGKWANFIITEKIPSYTYLLYSFGRPCIDSVYIRGKKQTA